MFFPLNYFSLSLQGLTSSFGVAGQCIGRGAERQLHAVRRRHEAVRRVGAREAGDGHLFAPPGAEFPVGAGRAGPGVRVPLRRLSKGPPHQGP